MSTFHAAAISKDLRGALDTITSDPSWSKLIHNAANRSPLSKVFPKSFDSRESRPTPTVRESCDKMHANCLDLIAAIDDYASTWGSLHLLNHPRYILKNDLTNALDDIQKRINGVMFDIRRLLKSSLQKYGKVISNHEIPIDRSPCGMSLERGVRYESIRMEFHCFHHPLTELLGNPVIFSQGSQSAPLFWIRYATSIARFLLIVFRHAEKYADRSDVKPDKRATIEWHKQIDAVEELEKARQTIQGRVIGQSHAKDTWSNVFNNIVLSHDHPLPLAAFVRQHLEFPSNPTSHRNVGSGSHNHDIADMPNDIHLISELINEIRGDGEGQNIHYLERVHDLRQAHAELTRKARELVSEMSTTTTSSGNRSYGTITIESGANAVLGDIVHNYIFGGSGNTAGTSDQHPQAERPGHQATGSGSVPNSSFGMANQPGFSFGPHPFDVQTAPQAGPQSSTPSAFMRSLFHSDSPSAPVIGRNSSGYHNTTSPQRQKQHVDQAAPWIYAASAPHHSATHSTYPTSASMPSNTKMSAAALDDDSMVDQLAPPAYTPSRSSKRELQRDIKSTISTPTSPLTSDHQPSDHSPRSPGSQLSKQTIRRRPMNTSTVSDNALMIPHATGILFSDYFESLGEAQRTS